MQGVLAKKNALSLICAFLCIIFTILVFGIGITPKNLINLFNQAAILGILALGQTVTILVGGIDFSMHWISCSAAIMLSQIYISSTLALSEIPPIIIIVIAIAVSSFIGLVNGVGIAYFDINPMIMTFAINALVHGVLLAWTNGISGKIIPPELKTFTSQSILGMPVLVCVWLIIIIISVIILNLSTIGRKLYAVGSNEIAAECSGIRIKRIKLVAYTFSGFIAGLGGILMAANLGTSSLFMSDDVTLQTIFVVLIGGTPITGGKGGYLGTVMGTILLVEIMYIFSSLKIYTGVQKILLGLILFGFIVTSAQWNRHALLNKTNIK